jgi:hypothetical protein
MSIRITDHCVCVVNRKVGLSSFGVSGPEVIPYPSLNGQKGRSEQTRELHQLDCRTAGSPRFATNSKNVRMGIGGLRGAQHMADITEGMICV